VGCVVNLLTANPASGARLEKMRIGELFIIILFGLIIIALLPVLLPVAACLYVKAKFDNVRFKRYLNDHEGQTFFAYTDKQSSQKYVETEILPFLPPETRIFHLAGKKGRYNMRDDFGLLTHAVGTMRKTKGGFPYISKIVEGELSTESINNRLYSAIRRGVGAGEIIKRVIKFYAS